MSGRSDDALQRAWSVLDVPLGDELASFRLGVQFSGVDCRVAQDRDRIRHLLVPCVDEVPQTESRSSVLSTSVRELAFGGQTETYLDVTCADTSLHPEFDDLIRDILEEIEGSAAPATEAIRVIARWRRLFQSRLVRGLSAEAKLGLFAELSVLGALLDANTGFEVESWRGPLREPHDFEMPARCIEVKAIGVESDTFTVHGWEQLAEHGGRVLDLALVTVFREPDGTALIDLVEAVGRRVRSRSTFAARLLAAGWQPGNAGDDQDRFALGPVFGIRINEAIPRLVPSSLVTGQWPEGISNLRYEVEVALVVPQAWGSSLATVASGLND